MNALWIADTQNDRIKDDCSLTLTAPNGSVVVSENPCGVILVPISG